MKTHEIISEAGIWQTMGTGILKGLGSLVGRGATWRTAEEYAPEIAKKASQLGRKLSDAEVSKIVKNSSGGGKMIVVEPNAGTSRVTGRVVLRDRGVTVAAGVIV
jgi:hypothetical protein